METKMEPVNTLSGLTSVRYISSWNAGRMEHEDRTAEEMIEKLFTMIAEHTLDPTFENYGGFIQVNPKLVRGGRGDYTNIFGNFYDYSFVFNIETKDGELVKRFKKAVAANKLKASYKEAKVVREQQEKDKLASYKLGGAEVKSMERTRFERQAAND